MGEISVGRQHLDRLLADSAGASYGAPYQRAFAELARTHQGRPAAEILPLLRRAADQALLAFTPCRPGRAGRSDQHRRAVCPARHGHLKIRAGAHPQDSASHSRFSKKCSLCRGWRVTVPARKIPSGGAPHACRRNRR